MSHDNRPRAVYVYGHSFVHRHGLICEDEYFSRYVWERYLKNFSDFHVVGRASSGHGVFVPEVRFTPVPEIKSLTGYKAAKKALENAVRNSDCMIVRMPCRFANIAVDVAEKLKKPWAVEVVGCPWDALWNHGSLLGKIYAPILTAQTRSRVKKAHFAIYVTRDFLQLRYPAAGALVVTAASNVEIEEPSRKVLSQRLERQGPKNGLVTLGLIGSLKTKQKGVHIVIKALSRMKDLHGSVRFKVLGGGDQEPWLALAKRYGVDKVVSFDGVLPSGDAVNRWLDEIDIYLQPSLQEGLPRALIEAMSRGCPAIGSDRAGIPELLPRCDLVRPGDDEDLELRLRAALNDYVWQESSAIRNWETAANYRASSLSVVRDTFWRQFCTHVSNF